MSGRELSRRNFIKGALGAGAGTIGVGAGAARIGAIGVGAIGVGAGGVGIGGVGAGALTAGMLGGCAPRSSNGKRDVVIAPGSVPYSVHEADIIIVGGGMSGLNAARVANDLGASVLLVDKGPAGHSGNSGVLWGQSFGSAEKSADGGASAGAFYAHDCMGIMDQEQARNVGKAHVEGRPRVVIEQTGNLFQRGDDSKVVGDDVPGMAAMHNALYKQAAQAIIKRGIPVYENMMMLDILLDEKETAAGIIAVSLADGSAHVFRGKKTILCTGGYHWACGKTGGSPESTGEGHYALLKRGFAFKDMEFPQYDFCGIHPFGYRPDSQLDMVDIAVTFPVNGEIHRRVCNKDKQAFTSSFFEDPSVQDLSAFQGTLIAIAKELYQGNGSIGDGSGNGILFDLRNMDSEPNSQSYPSYKGLISYSSANLGYTYPDYMECVVNEYSSAGVPVQDPETCEHEISGLYTVFVALSAGSSSWNWGQSYLAAKDASGKAAAMDALPAFSPEDVEAALKAAYGLLERDASSAGGSGAGGSGAGGAGAGGANAGAGAGASGAGPDGALRPTEVQRRIQRAFYRGQDFIKSEAGILAMLDELERIRKEDLPRMACADKSRVFNRDWRMAMEAEGMLYCSLATAHAALARRESRSPFFRSDHPKMNNSEYLCHLWVSIGENGTWQVEKGDIVDSVVPRAELLKALDDSDPRYDISIPNGR
jgi:succinate dehydrogenase/fumarate reductase flavoprotein subunit